MDAFALFSHPVWFLCSLALSVMLWAGRRRRWSPGTCPVDLSGQTAIVTGANCGIGKYVALDLARRNAHTILACRSKERGQAALEEIRQATGNPHVQLRILDTSCMASVRDFVRRFLEEERQLHILVNNAGAVGLPYRITSEGLEQLFATNVLGAFLLTNLLLGTMAASAPARIVNVSSFRHHIGKVNLKFLTGEERPKSSNQAYCSSKLMNIVFSNELARRLQGTAEPLWVVRSNSSFLSEVHMMPHVTGVSVSAQEPGVVKTEIMRHYSWWARLLFSICGIFMKSAREGATSTLYCAVSKEVEGISGKFFDSNCSLKTPLAVAEDPEVGRKLWDALEKLTGLENSGRR